MPLPRHAWSTAWTSSTSHYPRPTGSPPSSSNTTGPERLYAFASHGEMSVKIAFMPGDGIGPEVAGQALKVLREMVPNVQTEEAPIGLAGIEARGTPLPAE